MSYVNLCAQYITTINNGKNFPNAPMAKGSCFDESRPTVKIDSIIAQVQDVSDAIYSAADALFDDNTQELPYGEKVHFITLNAYGNSAKRLEEYIEGTNEFVSRPEFFYTRGEFYDSLAGINKGEYLYYFDAHVSNIINCFNKYQNLWLDYYHAPLLDPESGEVIKSELNYFWDKYYSAFDVEISKEITSLPLIVVDFTTLYNFIYHYKNIYYQANFNMSLSEIFLSSIDNEALDNSKPLNTIFESIDYSGFNMYNVEVAQAFNIFKQSVNDKDTFFSGVNDYGDTLRKINQSKVFNSINFFIDATSIYQWVKNFRKKYNI